MTRPGGRRRSGRARVRGRNSGQKAQTRLDVAGRGRSRTDDTDAADEQRAPSPASRGQTPNPPRPGHRFDLDIAAPAPQEPKPRRVPRPETAHDRIPATARLLRRQGYDDRDSIEAAAMLEACETMHRIMSAADRRPGADL